jgi:adenylylsulfate kinase
MKNLAELVWHASAVQPEGREMLLGQRPLTVWLTGFSGAGKSTLATSLERVLIEAGRAVYVLDGDNVRHGLNRDLGFSPEDRKENIRRVSEVARLMNDAGLIVITAFISPYRDDRAAARHIIGDARFVEVYLNTPLSVCEQRDPKGFYRRAREGGFTQFTGVDAPYEEPLGADLTIDTSIKPLQECVSAVMELVCPIVALQGGR